MPTGMLAGCLPWGSRREAELTDVPFSFSRSKRRRRARRWPLALAVLAALVIGGLAAALLVRTIQYRHETVPGVRVLGQDVGGRSRVALERRIEQIVGARLAQPVTILAGRKTVSVRPDRVRFRSEAPRIETLAAKVAAAEVVTFLSAPVSLSFDGQDVGSLSPEALARLLRFRPQGTGYSVVFAPKPLVAAVEPKVKRF